MLMIGIDTGGTFTDFVVYDGTSLRVHKVLSTPQAPERAILQGLADLGLTRADARIVHGSTVATNTLLEGKGARTVFITNRGFGDVLTIGRQARAALYDLTPSPSAPPVAAELCLETGGRLGADGKVVEALTAADLENLRTAVAALAPEAVAVSLLFSYLDPVFEQAIAAALPAALFVSLSSEVLPEMREYERGIATWLNASTGPVMQRYLGTLAAQLAPARLAVMQSSAVTCDADFAAHHAVNLLLSGPAGGLLGAREVAREAGIERIMTFDMGGTSTDVALIDGAIGLSTEGRLGRFPVGVPMVDMQTIGAGGGSIARVDAGGLLHVGPQSAGAAPGPVCYGAGGVEVTVTDANLVLGRLPAGIRLAGRVALDRDAAHDALERLGGALGGVSAVAAAEGVIAIANEHMQQALREISVERGIDPREFTLVSFGGAGGLHVCALAEALGMRHALVPTCAGVLSALGMVVARPGRRLSRTWRHRLDSRLEDDAVQRAVDEAFTEIAAPGYVALAEEGYPRAAVTATRSVDLRYLGQSHALNFAWSHPRALVAAFHEEHEHRYGHRLDVPVELVNLRVALDGPPAALGGTRATMGDHVAGHDGAESPYRVVAREDLIAHTALAGPAVVIDNIGTTFVASGWTATLDPNGNLHLELG